MAPPACRRPPPCDNGAVTEPLPVLIVDDQAPFRAAMKAVLKRTTEFELVGEAANGSEAVSLAGELHPALVLMDINMPEMNGIDATRLLVSQQPDVVVILCSTYDAGDLPREVATSGARAYLNKEHLGADTLRELWSHRDNKEFTSA
jgi:DNA-binding NarL/FixJ family response regulator